jgi:hypothetical protein
MTIHEQESLARFEKKLEEQRQFKVTMQRVKVATVVSICLNIYCKTYVWVSIPTLFLFCMVGCNSEELRNQMATWVTVAAIGCFTVTYAVRVVPPTYGRETILDAVPSQYHKMITKALDKVDKRSEEQRSNVALRPGQ